MIVVFNCKTFSESCNDSSTKKNCKKVRSRRRNASSSSQVSSNSESEVVLEMEAFTFDDLVDREQEKVPEIPQGTLFTCSF